MTSFAKSRSTTNNELPWYLQKLAKDQEDSETWIIRPYGQISLKAEDCVDSSVECFSSGPDSVSSRDSLPPIMDVDLVDTGKATVRATTVSRSKRIVSYIQAHPEEFAPVLHNRQNIDRRSKYEATKSFRFQFWILRRFSDWYRDQWKGWGYWEFYFVALIVTFFMFLLYGKTLLNASRIQNLKSVCRSQERDRKRRRSQRNKRRIQKGECIALQLNKQQQEKELERTASICSHNFTHEKSYSNIMTVCPDFKDSSPNTKQRVDEQTLDPPHLKSETSVAESGVTSLLVSSHRPLASHSVLPFSLQPLDIQELNAGLFRTDSCPSSHLSTTVSNHKQQIIPCPKEIKESIHAISSVLSSSGLNRQSSLKIASETVIRRLEMEYQHSICQQYEKKKFTIQQLWRMNDFMIEERRHRETIDALKTNASSTHKFDAACSRLHQAALNLFPGRHLVFCIVLAFAAQTAKYNSTFYVKIFDNNMDNMERIVTVLDIVASKACQCKGTKTFQSSFFLAAEGDSGYWGLSYTLTNFVAVTLYWFMPSLSCVGFCFFRFLALTSVFFGFHWFMEKCHFHGFIHQIFNLIIFTLTFSQQLKNVLFTVVLPVLSANIFIAIMGITLFYRGQRTKVSNGSKMEVKMKDGVTLSYQMIFLMYSLSTIVASMIGLTSVLRKLEMK